MTLFAVEVDAGTLWTAFVLGVLSIVAAFSKGIKDWVTALLEVRTNRAKGLDPQGKPLPATVKQSNYDAFVRLVKFGRQWDRLKLIGGIDRLMLMVGANGGGVPDMTSDYKVVCKEGWSRDEKRNPLEMYDLNLIVDTPYCEMIATMIRDGQVTQTFTKMPPSMLRRFYKDEGVFQTVVYLLNIDGNNNRMMFLSVANYSREFTEDELSTMSNRVDRMRAILSNEDDGSGLHPSLKI